MICLNKIIIQYYKCANKYTINILPVNLYAKIQDTLSVVDLFEFYSDETLSFLIY